MKNSSQHRYHFLAQSISTGIQRGGLPFVDIFVGGFFGAIHGVIRAGTRKPLASDALCTLLAHVNELSELNTQEQADFISDIIEQYASTKSLMACSDSSENLFNYLKNAQNPTSTKIAYIVDYIKKNNGDGIYENNGKKFFRIIASKVETMKFPRQRTSGCSP